MSTKIALVTGGSRGLGKNMAIALAKKGIYVVLTYHTNKAAADEVVAEIQSLGQKATAFQLDTRDVKSFDNFIKEVSAYLQEITGSSTFDFLDQQCRYGRLCSCYRCNRRTVGRVGKYTLQRRIFLDTKSVAVYQ
ncbi:MAG: SDR family NAD(P)-dependent oxidoreductase [Pirellulales bacterium]